MAHHPPVIVSGIQQLSRSLERAVVTIGNFDGVHLGHQAIIRAAVAQARARGGQAVAYTFRPHPRVALNPASEIQLLSTYDERLELLAAQGLDVIVEEPFSREFSSSSAETFFSDVLLRRLSAQAIVVGYDFAFGKGREGHLETLEKLCKASGVELTVIAPQRIGSEVVSSSRIRQHILDGDLEAAARLLGRPFSYRGVVIKGEGRGRKIGFPTANLKLDKKLTLPYGVYATWATLEPALGGKRYPSVTNVGVRPTFQQGERELPALVECHLLDASIDLYGSTLEVGFVKKLRAEKKFSGIEELKSQIARDAGDARVILAALP